MGNKKSSVLRLVSSASRRVIRAAGTKAATDDAVASEPKTGRDSYVFGYSGFDTSRTKTSIFERSVDGSLATSISRSFSGDKGGDKDSGCFGRFLPGTFPNHKTR
jgi:hypothetical protein